MSSLFREISQARFTIKAKLAEIWYPQPECTEIYLHCFYEVFWDHVADT